MSKTHGAKDRTPRTRRANPRRFRNLYTDEPDGKNNVQLPNHVLAHLERIAEEAGDNGVVAYLSRLEIESRIF